MKNCFRLVSALLVLVFLLSMTACSGTSTLSESSAPSSTTSIAPSSSESVSTTQPTAKDYSKKMTISFATIMIDEGLDYNQGDEMTKFFRNKYNFDWNIISLTFDNWAEKMRIWINSGDMPDMATWDYIHGEALNYSEQNLVLRFPDDWKTKWPNTAKAYENSVVGPEVEKIVGGTYFLPKPIFSSNKPCDPLIGHTTLYIRKDWAVAVGFPVKNSYSISELMQYATLVKQKDPGGIGSKLLPISVVPSSAAMLFVQSNNANFASIYKGEDGKYRWGAADNSTLEGLKQYQKAYREGLLNPDFFSLKGSDDWEQFRTTGVSGSVYASGMAMFQYEFAQYLKKNLNLDSNSAMQASFVVGIDNKYHQTETNNFWTVTIFSPKIETEKFDRIMDMIDYAATNEGQLLIRMGFEGKDFETLSGGGYKNLRPEGKSIYDVYPSQYSVYGNMVILSDDFGMIDPTIPQEFRDHAKQLYQGKSTSGDSTTIPRTDWKLYFYDSPNARKIIFDYGIEYARLILQDGDIEANWKTWLNEKAPLIKPVLDELNSLNK